MPFTEAASTVTAKYIPSSSDPVVYLPVDYAYGKQIPSTTGTLYWDWERNYVTTPYYDKAGLIEKLDKLIASEVLDEINERETTIYRDVLIPTEDLEKAGIIQRDPEPVKIKDIWYD